MKKKTVSDLYQRYKGQPLWIAGSGPSLAEYPDDFFENRRALTLHLAHVKFPGASFRYSSEYDRSLYLGENFEEYKKLPLIAAYPLYGTTKKQTEELLKDYSEVYYHSMVSYPPTGVRGEVSRDFTSWKVNQTLKGKSSIWGGHGTCLHTAFYMAILMGASEIHLIGAGHGLYKTGQEHFSAVEADHHTMRPGYRPFSDPVEHVPLIEQTLILGEECEKRGIPFFWHKTWSENLDSYLDIDKSWLAEEKERAQRSFSLKRRIYWSLVKRPINRFISRI